MTVKKLVQQQNLCMITSGGILFKVILMRHCDRFQLLYFIMLKAVIDCFKFVRHFLTIFYPHFMKIHQSFYTPLSKISQLSY